ncbi:hypothetical protein SAMN05216299_13212 [Nitrosospira sp. Nsp14]|uniref:EexN family lipoprotein n=1 Tax=Nitrosospira sp. Nsp14 TaxID=1855333 RepID=UPI0008E3E8FF|nr:EexN family lipoprotein [Nitrosospira sp. Nsp14]SFH60406.1 hypothetical protein SAMN05216299_13212 [Nitrosospira sp. Nsp14]
MKQKTLVISASALLILALAGCETREPQEEIRTVDWYVAHETERTAKLAECRSKPGTTDATPNCINASRAENEAKGEAKWGTEKEGVWTEPSIPIVP